MNSIQIADETFVAAPGAAVAAAIGMPGKWRRWWPDLELAVVSDRADKGIRWRISGGLVGTMEVWLEPVMDGVILHYFVHAEPTRPMRRPVAGVRARRVAGKRMSFEVKAELEAGRTIGLAS